MKVLAILAFLLCGLHPALAHETTRSYVTLARDGASVDVAFRVAFRDVEVAVWIDEDFDGALTWGETRRRLDAIGNYLAAGVTLGAGGDCPLTRSTASASETGGIAYLDIAFTATCPSDAASLVVTSRLFEDIDADHRLFLTALVSGETTTTVLGEGTRAVTLEAGTGGPLAALAAYFLLGVQHLLGGADHLVFLLVLILPAVAVTGPQRPPFRVAALSVLTAVTGFTIAHALTLAAATTDLLRPPTDVIEVLIAVSIVVTALDNLRPFLPGSRTAVAAFFGLIHGFGFASALGVLDAGGWALATALLGFNLGIEVAQIGVVLLAMPALYVLGGGRPLLWTGSALAGAVGLWWVWERALA